MRLLREQEAGGSNPLTPTISSRMRNKANKLLIYIVCLSAIWLYAVKYVDGIKYYDLYNRILAQNDGFTMANHCDTSHLARHLTSVLLAFPKPQHITLYWLVQTPH